MVFPLSSQQVHLELEEITQSKASLNSPNERAELQPDKLNNIPERSKFHEIWEKHSFSLVVIPITVILFIYSIVAIAVSGFQKAKWLFFLTMFLWFCMVYMIIRDRCGKQIYEAAIRPVVVALRGQWYWLRW